MRLGELLVAQGTLDEVRVRAVLDRQSVTGEPFGVACERLFGIDPATIEGAWARQYAELVGRIDPRLEETDPDAAAAVSARQARQFRIAPLRHEDGHLVVATTVASLPRALRFATSSIATPVFFVLVEEGSLERHLAARYPLPGLDAERIAGLLETARRRLA